MATTELVVGAMSLGSALLEFAEQLSRRYPSRKHWGEQRIGEYVRTHVTTAQKWALAVRVDPLSEPRTLQDMYVDLDLGLKIRRIHGAVAESNRQFKVSDLKDVHRSVALLGDPGAGKTTSVKRLVSQSFKSPLEVVSVPVLIRLRELGGRGGLLEALGGTLGLRLRTKSGRQVRPETMVRVVASLLDSLKATVYLDGLDEVPRPFAASVVNALNDLILTTQRTRFVVTCRSAAFNHTIEDCAVAELRGLSETQVEALASRWLGSKHKEFLNQLAESPYNAAQPRPLTISVLALIYLRKGQLPAQPKTIYEKIIRLFLEDWDASKSVRRESEYADFSIERKEEFLEALAYKLCLRYRKGLFHHSDLIGIYNEVHSWFGLPANQGVSVAREVESHSGLILEKGEEEFEFFHLSIQEYLTARYITKSGIICPPGVRVSDYPNEYALAVAFSSEPTMFFREVVQRYLAEAEIDERRGMNSHFPLQFIERIKQEKPAWRVDEAFGAALCMLLPALAEETADIQMVVDPLVRLPEVEDSLRAFSRYLKNAPPSEWREIDYPAIEQDATAELLMFLQAIGRPHSALVPGYERAA